jgi:hypothetical protein
MLPLARLASLPAPGPLPERTVLVRAESVAHVWRRELAISGHARLLVGTRFITPLAAAAEVLALAGIAFAPGEETIRPSRIAAIFATPLSLEHFDLALLRSKPGWDAAFARTIGELEAAGLEPARLAGHADRRVRDVARVWERVDAAAGSSWTAARVLREAALLLDRQASLWPFGGPTLVEVTGHESAVLARFVRAIPNVSLAYDVAKPERRAHAERVKALFGLGSPAHTTVPATPAARADASLTERVLLQRYLFAPPEVLTMKERPRSAGPDGTVQLEEHAGLEEELDATAAWILGEIAEHGTPLEQIAIVVPSLEPYGPLLVDRLAALAPTPDDDPPVHVVGGLPASGTFAGARALAVVRALRAHLHVDEVAELLPALRLPASDDGEELHLTRKDALSALYELGTVGGSAARPDGAFEWSSRRPDRVRALEHALARFRKDEDDEREREALERALAHLRAVGPALDALVGVARLVADKAPLAALWDALAGFLSEHVKLGAEGAKLVAMAAAAVRPLAAAKVLSGDEALGAIESTLRSLRVPLGRFGEPRVTIAALRDAVGLRFQAVRVLGLAEGVLPPSRRDDPVLPDEVRRTLGALVPTVESRALEPLHALHRVIARTSERLVLSAPRMGADGGYREPSMVFMEALAALGRAGTAIPDARTVRLHGFAHGRKSLEDVRAAWPVIEGARLDRAARERTIPPAWAAPESPALDLDRLLAPPAEDAGPMDGWFPTDGPFPALPGLTAERPTSASALGTLLSCPHKFLYERVLGWRAPPEPLDEGSLDALAYGTLFHAAAEDFYRAHGAAFCAKPQPLDQWNAELARIASARFDAFLEGHPLVGKDVQDAQCARLLRDLRALLELDAAEPKKFVAVEQPFGPVALSFGKESLHVEGTIDRLDTIGKTTLVRDLKTGKVKTRTGKGKAFIPGYDIQLGVYARAVQTMAKAWKVPGDVVGAFVYPADPGGEERSFRDDADALEEKVDLWGATAARLLRLRVFPRSPDGGDCTYCDFQPVCGPTAQARAFDLLSRERDERPKGAAAAFARMKLEEDGDA